MDTERVCNAYVDNLLRERYKGPRSADPSWLWSLWLVERVREISESGSIDGGTCRPPRATSS
eukprot:scaffold14081_cov138-Skeletonema_menzelii.AAC.8